MATAAAASARLTLCRYVQRERMLYVRFADAAKDYRLPAEYLRAFSPAARATGPDGRPAVVSRRKYVGIMHIDPVGRYGLRCACARGGVCARIGAPCLTDARACVCSCSCSCSCACAGRVAFDDMHAEGIFSFDLLHELALHKLSNLRMYIRELRERGLSRDPRVRPAPLPAPLERAMP